MRSATLLIFIFIMSACASVNDSKKTITLDTATRHYERAIRWGEYQAADSFRRQSTTTPADIARLKAIRVTSYETVRTRESADRTGVQIDVVIRYYNESTLKEVTITDYQSWQYDTVEKSWHITSPMPAFK
jgi:hypothetical protein